MDERELRIVDEFNSLCLNKKMYRTLIAIEIEWEKLWDCNKDDNINAIKDYVI